MAQIKYVMPLQARTQAVINLMLVRASKLQVVSLTPEEIKSVRKDILEWVEMIGS